MSNAKKIRWFGVILAVIGVGIFFAERNAEDFWLQVISVSLMILGTVAFTLSFVLKWEGLSDPKDGSLAGPYIPQFPYVDQGTISEAIPRKSDESEST